MTTVNTRSRYSTLSIGLHWLMFLLIVAAYVAMELREGYPRGSDTRELFKSIHYMVGLSVLGLVIVRLATRLLTPGPVPLEEPVWRSLMSKAVHAAAALFHHYVLRDGLMNRMRLGQG